MRFKALLLVFVTVPLISAVAEDKPKDPPLGSFFEDDQIKSDFSWDGPGEKRAPEEPKPRPSVSVEKLFAPSPTAKPSAAPRPEQQLQAAPTPKKAIGNAFEKPTPKPSPSPVASENGMSGAERDTDDSFQVPGGTSKLPKDIVERMRDSVGAAKTSDNAIERGRFVIDSVRGADKNANPRNPATAPSPSDDSAARNKTFFSDAPKTLDPTSRPIPPQGIELYLIVSANPEQHLLKHLKSLKRLTEENPSVRVQEVVVVGSNMSLVSGGFDSSDIEEISSEISKMSIKSSDFAKIGPINAGMLSSALKQFNEKSVSEPLAITTKLGLKRTSLPSAKAYLSRFGIEQSPAWIVRDGSTFHVFQGEYDPAEFFDVNGRFSAR